MVYCNSTVTIDLAGSFIFRIPLLIFTSLKGTNFTLSGFSKELMNMVCSSETNPYNALIKVLDAGKYDCVNTIV